MNTKNDIENYEKKIKKFLNLESNINDEWDSEYQKEFDYLKKRGLIKEDYNGEITFTHPIYHYASYMLLEEEYRETREKKELLIVKIEKLLYFPFSDMNLCTLDFIEKLYKKTLDEELKSIILNGLDDIFPSVKAEVVTFFSNNFANAIDLTNPNSNFVTPDEVKKKAEEEAKQKAEEEAKQKAAAEAKKKAEEEAKQKADAKKKAEAQKKSNVNSKGVVKYKVKWGDTLWDLSETYYKTPWLYKKIADYNKIKNPNLIIAGTYIDIPPK